MGAGGYFMEVPWALPVGLHKDFVNGVHWIAGDAFCRTASLFAKERVSLGSAVMASAIFTEAPVINEVITYSLTLYRKGYFERRCEMKKNILILLCFGILLVLPNLVLADCADLGSFSSFSVTGGNTVTLYSMNTPFVKFDVQCNIESTSRLQLIKGYVCDGDEVLVDGSRCTILNVTSSGF
jgi:hypothetical protein